jgi:HAD superfamily hydrolase (TIGR01509 family)
MSPMADVHSPVVFDLDGVLVDTEQAWDEVRRDIALAHGGTWPAGANAHMQGLSTPEWVAYMAEELGVRLGREALEHQVTAGLERRYAARPPFLPGAIETVRRLAAEGRRLAVASSSPRAIIDTLLEAGGIARCFEVVIASDEVARGKPFPDVYLEAARRLGVEPTECVAVEDSTNGLRAAATAGMEVLALPNRHVPPSDDAIALAAGVGASLPELF